MQADTSSKKIKKQRYTGLDHWGKEVFEWRLSIHKKIR